MELWLVAAIAIIAIQNSMGRVDKVRPKDSCDKQRKLLTGSWGYISDGSKDYPEDSYCEWLITASRNQTGQFITVKFFEMETECSYDHIYIYDGDSYNSPLLGSFSGSTVPSPITANSGAMLILLYSDTNYARQGFQAEYSITNCPMNCSNHGLCLGSQCKCQHLWSGADCSISLCPDECGESSWRGACHQLLSPPRCICNPGYSGQSCSLPEVPIITTANTWHLLAQEGTGMSPRAGHGAAYSSSTDRLYIFGGYSFGEVLGDLLSFDFNSSQWLNMTVPGGPRPRWGHAMTIYAKNLVVFGGELSDGTLSNELWLYSIAKKEWSLEAQNSLVKPPPVTKHTLTLVDEKWLYAFGGSLEDGSFSSLMYAINLNEGALWKKIVPRGGKEVLRRLVGHTTVYHPASKSLLVFGGLMVDFARFSKLSSSLHAFHIEKRYWTRIHYPAHRQMGNGIVPFERAFHTAAIVESYLVIYGGYTHRHSQEEICYDNSFYFYHLECHKWVEGRKMMLDFQGAKNPVPRGVLAHTMVVRGGQSLIITGGYNGVMRGSLLAYVLPFSAGNGLKQQKSTGCEWHRSKESCVANMNCGWCHNPDRGTCLERTNSQACQIGTFGAQYCAGLCPTLRDCQSCLAWGEAGGANLIGADVSPGPICFWCAQAVQCHAVSDVPKLCWAGDNNKDPDSTPTNWWGNNGADIISLKSCRIKDSRPGLTSLKYRHPPNYDQPDEVSYVNLTSEDVSFHYEFSREKARTSVGNNIARFHGFIHPLGVKPNSERSSSLQLSIGSVAKALLKMSTDETEEHLEVVANHTSSSFTRTEAHRPNWPNSRQKNRLLFPNSSYGHKYLTDFTVELPVTDNGTVTMQLVWNAFGPRLEKIPVNFLEPYNNKSSNSCALLVTCLACMSNQACGWCQIKQECMPRLMDGALGPLCHSQGDIHHLVMVPEDCTTCGNYIDCHSCVEMKTCEWLVEEAHCIRKGRFKDAITELDYCPLPCHMRQNCSSCLGDPGRCAWCEESQSCFLFATYTTTFMFGRCREWVDEDRAVPRGIDNKGAQCKDCSRNHECKSCLTHLGCGWCGSNQNPSLGLCVPGDFAGPSAGDCTAVLMTNGSSYSNLSIAESAEWSYTTCPDIEECRMGLHNCNANATCINTQESFYCVCKQGFKGDGVQKCLRTCIEDCDHGYCSESPLYKCNCDLGWTGKDCSVNCGCHNHSSCNQGVGICDQCQGHTQGKFCEQCRSGSYGNATTETGCQPCNCNKHGDKALGYCDSLVGICFCTDNTEGTFCERCKPGNYGDPKNGGNCYLECRPRQIITNVTSGRLGSQLVPHSSTHCLWILTVHPEFNEDVERLPLSSNGPSISLKIHRDMKVKCPQNRIYVYDGLPDFVAPNRLKRLLGTFCGTKLTKPIETVATSGFLTIYYEARDPTQGFNSSYARVPWCNACTTPECRKTCYRGTSSCPNCSMGTCDEELGLCQCSAGFGGPNCTIPLHSSHVQWTVHYDQDAVVWSESPQPSSRMGHSLMANNNRLWLFGGFSTVKGDLNDLFMFDLNRQRWEEVIPASKAQDSPVGRHLHGTALVNGDLYIYGGLNRNGILGDFWKFSLIGRTWQQIRVPLPTLLELSEQAGLTLTTVDSNIIMIGGFSPYYGFLEKVLEYSTVQQQWQILNCSGSFPVGLYGHSSVYHPATQTIYVFGGVVYKVDRPVISSSLYAFHYPSRRWSILPVDLERNPSSTGLTPRYFHVAVVLDNYIVVTGGRNNASELLSDTVIYNIDCNAWMAIEVKDVLRVGTPPLPSVGAAGVYISGRIYFFGGYNGQTLGQLISLRLPKDVCRLFGSNRVDCVQRLGCSYCVISENGDNRTFCYSLDGAMPASCQNPSGGGFTQGTSCSREWLEKRTCYQYNRCSDCVAFWPAHSDAKQVCQWCSNCQVGRCIPAGASCEKENDCNVPQRVINKPGQCPWRVCLASDCEKCTNLNICIWTRSVLRSSEWGHSLNAKPVYDWTCVWNTIQDISTFSVESMPPHACPMRCKEYKNCTACTQSTGGEGGWHECHWSSALNECMSPSYELLRCDGSSCGSVLTGSQSHECPVPCSEHAQAAHCLKHPDCGWCAFSGPLVDGRGLCMSGGILGPIGGSCEQGRVVLFGKRLPPGVSNWLAQSTGPPFWTYLEKPEENECLNEHHTCDDWHEECVDTLEGFQCHCKKGYTLEGDLCKPVCTQGCVFGTCVEPDNCQCHFGYVGRNCSTQCDCNSHSECAGIDKLGECILCHNNTKGSNCQKCRPLFVGNPVNGNKCTPCSEYCNSHSDICMAPGLLNHSFTDKNGTFSRFEAISHILQNEKEGPMNQAICLNCQNNTEGAKCDSCMHGYFMAGLNITAGCRLCECHGHGDQCNPMNGEGCICHNNTENDRQCSQKNNKNGVQVPCWQMQCSKCKEYFLGTPTQGHQCYRHMFLDKDYCFDPNTQDQCITKPSPLLQGRTVFFVVQPRYMNVDIRITVDVTQGAADFYMSAKEDTFFVDVNKSNGIHSIFVDRKYAVDMVRGNELPEWVRRDRPLRKREAIMEELLQELPNSTESYTGTPLLLREIQATGLTTYITVKNPQEFLLIRNLQYRLVITIPQEVHDLRNTRFYMILRGARTPNAEKTYGSLFFRQDQTRIDLFVFFSVFFSCFFLFLAICVVVWKVKQALDVRQARRLHAAEMKHMASRPFGQICAVIEDEPEEFEFLLYSPMNYRRKPKGKGHHNHHHHHIHHHHHHPGRDSPKGNHEEKIYVRPLAMEPTFDGMAAVSTVLIQLPGGLMAPVRLSLGSSLVTVRHSYHFGNSGIRAVMRRRASYVVL